MAKKVYDEDGLDMQKTDWSGDESTGNLPVRTVRARSI